MKNSETITVTRSKSGKNTSESTDIKLAFINDIPFETKPGETILSFLNRHIGKGKVPTLCDAPNLKPYGACRVCSVDVALSHNGKRKVQWKIDIG